MSAAPGAPARPGTFLGIQALRAVAALLVVLLHAIEMWHIRLDPAGSRDFWMNGAAGVDIFFVISGFVMMVSSHHLAAVPGGWRVFAWRRFVRIAPFYWAITTLKILSVVAVPALALRTVLDPGTVVASYLFLPWRDPSGALSPVLPVGWTLNLEAAFYLLFAVALAAGGGLLRVTLPVLAMAAAASLIVPADGPGIVLYLNPIVLEFGAGLALGALALRGRALPAGAAVAAVAVGFALLLLVPPVLPRVLSWGVPAALIVAGVIALEAPLRRLLPGWALLLGDASYAIYLTHGFAVAALGVVLARLPLAPTASFALAVAAGCLLSAAAGIVTHLWLERPLVERFRRLGPRRATRAA